jgi:PadR family transcriptional regulator
LDERRELLRGNTVTLVLAVLKDGPLHGYGIAREIERRSGEVLRFREGTLYPALHALERDGWIAGRWETPGGPARKVYAITEAGLAELAHRTRSWQVFACAVNRVLEGAPDVQPA